MFTKLSRFSQLFRLYTSAPHGHLSESKLISLGKPCPWLQIKFGWLTNGYSGSLEKLSLISKWTEECLTGHTECYQTEAPLPTRVLDLRHSPADVIRVCPGRALSARYCALSHCVRITSSRCFLTKNWSLFTRYFFLCALVSASSP
jgi:hypothetical protein